MKASNTTRPFEESPHTAPCIRAEKKVAQQDMDLAKTKLRSVSFNPQVSICPPSSQEEIAPLWYDQDEIASIKADCEITIRAMASRKHLDSDLYTIRGLESRAPGMHRRLQKQKLAILDAVLDTQDLQRKHGIVDQHTIAAIYHKYSAPQQEAAHQAGIRDAKSVQETSSKSSSGSRGFRKSILHRIKGNSRETNATRSP